MGLEDVWLFLLPLDAPSPISSAMVSVSATAPQETMKTPKVESAEAARLIASAALLTHSVMLAMLVST